MSENIVTFLGTGSMNGSIAAGLLASGFTAENVRATVRSEESAKKLSEHGGFSHDDTNVVMLFANPGFKAQTVSSPVETVQIAPTILQVLGLNPRSLQAVRLEGTAVLPAVAGQVRLQ